jgi:hypothetical protein
LSVFAPRASFLHVLSGLALAFALERPARAQAAAEPSADTPGPASPLFEERDREKFRRRLKVASETGSYFDFLATAMLGTGLRFNNPYRLPSELGSNGESVSSTPGYLDLALLVTSGNPNGLQHGGRLGWSVSLAGVPQQVVTPAYTALYRRASWIFYGWAGLPVLAEPDFNIGAELALGATWMARAGIGLTGALVGDGFYGAGTRETAAAFYPVLSAQLGFLVSYEDLP